MKILREGIASLLITLAVWMLFSWPLPRDLFTTIPYNAANVEDAQVIRQMEPGDHLQLMYHFWLFKDMLTGHTPWFHNLYEFNLENYGKALQHGLYGGW